MKVFICFIFALTLFSSPILEKISFIYDMETSELLDIDTDNEIDEEVEEIEKIEDIILSANLQSTQNQVAYDRNSISIVKQDILDFYHREIHTPPPELV